MVCGGSVGRNRAEPGAPLVIERGLFCSLMLYSKQAAEAAGKGMTMPIEWTEDLAIGEEKIDNQHREMFQRIKAP